MVFIPHTKPADPNEPRLLIIDGHGSHTTDDFLYICFKNHIYLLFLPPHTSHVLQPLDLAVFSSLKSGYRNQIDLLVQATDSTIVGKRNFLCCYQKARTTGLTSKNITSRWKATGLWPVNMAKPLMSGLLLKGIVLELGQTFRDLIYTPQVSTRPDSTSNSSSAIA